MPTARTVNLGGGSFVILMVDALVVTMADNPEADDPEAGGREPHTLHDRGGSPYTAYVSEDFDAFFARDYPRVVALAYALCGNRAVAEDLTQDAFVAAYRRARGGHDIANLAGYVRSSVANGSRSLVRRRLAEARALARLRRRPARVELPEASERFWAAVRSLPRRQAQVVALFYAEDRSVADIASLLGMAEPTVKVHLHRARLALAPRLGAEPPEEL
jgi:RNA polymerase sigma-70 factor (ECF subfamily)